MLRENISAEWLCIKAPDQTIEEINGTEAYCWEEAECVSLPHTTYDDETQYHGLIIYKKQIALSNASKHFLEFEGVDQQCKVYVNQKLAGEHKGAYARFRVEIPAEYNEEKQVEVVVYVYNKVGETISPLIGDFTVFGGMYRPVSLLSCEENHFDYGYYGTDGVILRATVEEGKGCVNLEPHAVVKSDDTMISYTIYGEEDEVVFEQLEKAKVSVQAFIENPVLWQGRKQAHFYTLEAKLLAGEHVCDTTKIRFGFRSMELDAQKGFFLNGAHMKLNGVAKHQDYKECYSAVTEKEIQKDFALIDEIGANAIRLSHYQHPQTTYNLCDEEGYVVWAEIPMLKMTENEELFANAKEQLRELILQNIHHPSIFCWGIQNEIGMFKDAPFMHAMCRELDGIVKELDADRYSAGANLYTVKPKSELNQVSDMVGYNIYFGWYYGQMNDYDKFLDKVHEVRPTLPLGVSEYGVDSNLSLHAEEPKVKDYSEEYQALFHETVYPIIDSKEYLWGSFVWNMFDFSSDRRDEGGIKNYNAKGLVTFDRETRKDAFYYYKAKWSKDVVLHIASKRFVKRAGEEIAIKVYTNLEKATLYVNGVELETKANNGNATVVFEKVFLKEAVNQIKVVSGEYTDTCTFEKVDKPEESYRLPDDGKGSMVKNWFLSDDDIVREGYYSIMDTAADLVECEETLQILRKYIPEIVHLLVDKEVIPMGLQMKSILGRSFGEDPDGMVKKINEELNQVKCEF